MFWKWNLMNEATKHHHIFWEKRLEWKKRGAGRSWVNCNPMRGAIIIIIRAGQAVVPMTSSRLFSVFWEDNAAFSFLSLTSSLLKSYKQAKSWILSIQTTFGNPMSKFYYYCCYCNNNVPCEYSVWCRFKTWIFKILNKIKDRQRLNLTPKAMLMKCGKCKQTFIPKYMWDSVMM